MDNLRFHFITWNVATKSPGQDLNALLDFPSQFNKNKPLPDFYVIGLQEVKSQPQNMILDSIFNDVWTSSFNKILCRQRYVIAKTVRLQGILLVVYTQMKHLTHLRDIEAQYTKTGLGGMWGNKGAVSVRFNIYGCSVCLVNCHLTAHEHLLADRINDYNTIVRQHVYHIAETSNILYHDYVFWMGDLNFRNDYPSGSSPTSEEIVEILQNVEKDKYNNLLKHDQLLAVMSTGEAFSEFTEAEIRFPPTYKFSIGSDEYDMKRKPSWTDRILYKVIANNYENITLRADLISYNHMDHYTVSDHKPVIAQFNIKTRHGFACTILSESPRAPRSGIRMRSAMVTPSVVTDQDLPNAENFSFGPDASVDDDYHSIRSQLQDVDEFASEAEHETFSNYTEKTVEFAPFSNIWYIGDADLRTQCTLTPDIQVNPSDWIGIYDADFYNLDDYKAYEYLAKVGLPESPIASGQPRTIALSIPVGSGIRTPGFYRLIYFSQPNNDVRSVLGISEPFEVSSKEERLVSLDPCEQPSCSTSVGQERPSTSADVFSEFTGLDVSKLTRHFSHDLSID